MLIRQTNELQGRRGSARRGAAIVEFALIAPLFAIFIVGLLQMGQAMRIKVLLSNAARKGCEIGIMPAKSNSDVTTEATSVLRAAGFDVTKFNPPTIGSVTVTVTDPSGNSVTDTLTAPSDSTVQVTVTIPVSSTMPILGSFFSATASQNDFVVMKKQ